MPATTSANRLAIQPNHKKPKESKPFIVYSFVSTPAMNQRKSFSPEEILDSLNDLQPAEPSPFLFTRIEARIATQKAQTDFSIRWVSRLAVATLLFIGLNVGTWVYFNQKSELSYEEGVANISSTYSLDSDIYF